ncbi:phage head-tail joining protein [Rhodobacter capsulatus]
MALMSFSQAELDALRRAYAAGALVVEYDGRRLTYGNAGDLLARIRFIEGQMATSSGGSRPVAGKASFSRGRT